MSWVLRTIAVFLATQTFSSSPRAMQEKWDAVAWQAPYDYSGPSRSVTITPIAKAQRPWRLCAAYPHLKDAYWISVNFGMVTQAIATGVRLKIVDAGGYPNIERQIAQLKKCARHADAVIVGPVSYDALTPVIREIAKRVPVIAAINDIAPEGITAKVGVSWTEMGRAVGTYLAEQHPANTPSVDIAWFPGPKKAGWVPFVDGGFRAGLAGSSAKISLMKWGDTGFEIQSRLVDEALEANPELNYLVGSAVTADAAVNILRERGRQQKTAVLANYFTHGTYRAIRRNRVLMAPTDSPVLQGRMVVDQAIRALQGMLEHRHVGPPIVLVDKNNIDAIDLSHSLAPAVFSPRFQVP